MPSPTGASTSGPTPSRRRRRRCGARWPTPRSATTCTARTRPSTGWSRWPPRCSARRPRSTCRRARWRTSSRSGCSAAPGTEVLCGERAHVYRYEHAAAGGERRRAAAPARRRRRRARRRRRSHALAGAAAPPPADRRAVHDREHAHARERAAVAHAPSSTRSRDVARAHGLAVHCDGARIWNAAIALGVVAGGAGRGRRHA